MKARPRGAENRIVDVLNELFERHGYAKVERIPVLGRTGPDISINETKMVIDVKSRKSCPISMMHQFFVYYSDGLCTIPVSRIPELIRYSPQPANSYSVTVKNWLDHMDEWTKENEPDGLSGIVLHKPGLDFDKAVLVFYETDIERFREIWKKQTKLH